MNEAVRMLAKIQHITGMQVVVVHNDKAWPGSPVEIRYHPPGSKDVSTYRAATLAIALRAVVGRCEKEQFELYSKARRAST